MLINLAWRNLWRRRRRTWITGGSIGFGIMLAVTFTGTGDYTYTNMIDTGARMGMGHVTLHQKDYNSSPSIDKRFSLDPGLLTTIENTAYVNAVYPRINGTAVFSSAVKAVGGAFYAVDFERETGENNIFIKSLTEGHLPAADDPYGVIVGKGLAKKLGLRIGRKLVYTITDVQGEIAGDVGRVRGVFRTGMSAIDDAMAVMWLDKARATAGYGKNEITSLVVLLRDQRKSGPVKDNIAARLEGPNGWLDIAVYTWKETQRQLYGLIKLDRQSNYIFQALILMIIGAGIFNTVLVSVMERRREFGVMLSLGLAPSRLFSLVVVESVFMSVVGIIIGIIITAPWFAYLYYVGLDFSEIIGEDYTAGGVLIDPIIHIRLFPESVVAIVSGIVGITVISGLYPAWKAGRLVPVEVLRIN